MLDSLLQTGIVQNLLKYLIWAFITGIFFSGVLVILESRLKSSCLKKVAYFFSFAGLLYLILIILSGSVEFEGTEKPSSLRLSSFNLDAFQKLPQLSQTIETIYVVGCWILLGGSLCSGLFIIIRRQFPKYKILNISYLFSFFGPILFVFLVWNKSLEVEDWEITGLNASWYQKAAENGNPWALVELGQCFLEGRGVKKNEEKAFKLFKKAADQGNLHAQLNVGFSYMNGIGVAKDEKKSFEWYSKAAERGDLDGQAKLGLFYENGEGVAQDYKEAFKWYTKAAEQGEDFAQTKLGLFYEKGRGVTQDYKEAFKWYTKAAEQGEDFAQTILGLFYEGGRGVTQDHKEAVKWYKKAAEQGDAFAQANLGRCYANGTGVDKDDTEAMKLYTKAAEQGDAYGQFLLGRRYLSGKGVAKDEKRAFEWLFKSAEQGNVDGQNSVGRCYGMGIGVAKDEKEARKWLKKAALNGNEEAEEILKTVPIYGRKPFSSDLVKKAEGGSSEDQLSLGRCYLYGEGVGKDVESAVKWLKKAAENNSYIEKTKVEARLLLAEIYSDEPIEAKKWYEAAAEEGDAPSKIKMAEFVLLDNPQSSEAKNQAERWLIEANSEGDPKSSIKLAKFYLQHDLNKAKILTLPLLYEAAGKGNGEAAYIVGHLYNEGKIVLKNKEKALEWFQHANQLGYKAANSNIKEIQKTPQSPDFSEALRLAAEAGETKSQLNLGLAYFLGQGVEADPELAEKWLIKAAEKKDPLACRSLAELYGGNQNFSFDPTLCGIEFYSRKNAVKWLHESAEASNPKAKILLSVLILLDESRSFQDGSETKIKRYLQPLATQGDTHAIKILKILRTETPFPFFSEVEEEARKGSPDAFLDLGYMYMWGDEQNGIPRDLDKAVANLKKSFEKGNARSAEYLHYIFSQLKPNKKEAEVWKQEKTFFKSKNEAEKKRRRKNKSKKLS